MKLKKLLIYASCIACTFGLYGCGKKHETKTFKSNNETSEQAIVDDEKKTEEKKEAATEAAKGNTSEAEATEAEVSKENDEEDDSLYIDKSANQSDEMSLKSNDVTSAKSVKTAVETVLCNEDIYMELKEKHVGELIIVSESGLSILSDKASEEIKINLGTMPKIKYYKDGAQRFAFVVNENDQVEVYVCTKDMSTKWKLAPEVEDAYISDDPEVIEYVNESKKSNDVSSAKTIWVSVETAMGDEDIYEDMVTNHANELIIYSNQGLSVLSDKTKSEIVTNSGSSELKVKYTHNGADHFAFMCDEKGYVKVYICNEDNSVKWEIEPNLDAEYR